MHRAFKFSIAEVKLNAYLLEFQCAWKIQWSTNTGIGGKNPYVYYILNIVASEVVPTFKDRIISKNIMDDEDPKAGLSLVFGVSNVFDGKKI